MAGRESRLVEQIEERIFNHLIRQSDVALAYEEGSDQEMEDEESGAETSRKIELSCNTRKCCKQYIKSDFVLF